MINSSKYKNFLRICITFMVAFNVYAYDGDVDYTAPYVTIDPETGTLVTVDPKTQTKTPHSTSGNTSSNVNDSTETTTSSTAAPEASQTASTEPQTTVTSLPIIIGLLLAGFAAAFVFRGKNKDQATSSGNDQNE